MEENSTLTLVEILRGNIYDGLQYYRLSLKDAFGKTYTAVIGCKPNYQESVERTFNRLLFIEFSNTSAAPTEPKKEIECEATTD